VVATPCIGADAAPAAIVADVPADYLLGPGDVVQVFVWRNSELSITVPIRPDGKISTPLVDDMVAIGKTPSQLARDLERVLAEYVLTPKVNVIVTASASASNQVKLVGQLRNPQSLPFRAGMTALDAVMAAGGLTDFASGNRAQVLRKGGDGKDQSIRLKIQDLLKGKLKYNIALKPGDVIVVPESLF
jgi:polysaccharide export outer membrane protein